MRLYIFLLLSLTFMSIRANEDTMAQVSRRYSEFDVSDVIDQFNFDEKELDSMKLVFTTIDPAEVGKDLDEEDVDDAKNLDIGRYSTQDFSFVNGQFLGVQKAPYQCEEAYVKCLISWSVPHPVCALNRFWNFHQYSNRREFQHICDAFYMNCYYGYRYWRIVDFGRCKNTDPFFVLPTI